jgi:hypothetical protein
MPPKTPYIDIDKDLLPKTEAVNEAAANIRERLAEFIGEANNVATLANIATEVQDALGQEVAVAGDVRNIGTVNISFPTREYSFAQHNTFTAVSANYASQNFPPPPAEPVVINALNGNQLYWSAQHNRWLIQGLPEAEQIAPQPPLPRPFFAGVPQVELPYIPLDVNPLDAPRYIREAKAKSAYYKAKTKPVKPMQFDDLDNGDKVEIMKQEFMLLVKTTFEKPDSLNAYVVSNKLSKDQAKAIFKQLRNFNSNKCMCCPKFDGKLLKTPIDRDLEPLIDLAQTTARARNY